MSLAKFAVLLLMSGMFCARALGENHVQVSLVSDVSAIQPGTPFRLGIKFKIDPGWHIYWKNPGDSGIATDVKLTLPDGFSAGPILFPVPHRLQLPGDIVNYAYEDEAMLMVSITPPKDLPIGKTVTLAGTSTWLVCKEDCIPGSGDVSVDLSVKDNVVPANLDLFKAWSTKLPVTEDRADIASTSTAMALTNGSGQVSISVGWNKQPDEVQFFPGPLRNGDMQNVKLTNNDLATKVVFDLKAYKGDEPITGLLTFTTAAGAKVGVEISIPATKQ